MRGEIIHPKELDAGLIDTWRALQAANPVIRSPFYAPEFTRAVGAVRDDARVAVLRRDNEIAGFLPHHEVRRGVAKPIGGQINDYHGLVAAEGAFDSADQLLRASSLSAYDFNHAPTAMSLLASGAFSSWSSPYMDLTGGFERYRENASKTRKHTIKETERRIRKMEREVGPVRFERNDRSEAAWSGLLKLKNLSYDRKGTKSVLDIPWVLETLDVLRTIDTPEFSGLLSTVYAGDRLIAAHFGIRSTGVWAWWFNTYDIELRNLAPGIVNIVEAAKICEQEKVVAIDFGKGDQQYKRTLATGCVPLCEGSIERRLRSPGMMRQAQKLALRLAKSIGDQRLQSFAKRATRKVVGGSMHLPAAPAN